MSQSTHSPQVLRFGVFDLDLPSGELRKAGARVRLQPRLFQLLLILLERRGTVVTREELRKRLWPADTFVDFDLSLNSALKKLRSALGDVADNPIFIETVPRRGYRFIATVTPIEVDDSPVTGRLARGSGQNGVQHLVPATIPKWAASPWRPGGRAFLIAAVTGLALLLIAISRWAAHPAALNPPPIELRSLAVLPLENLSHDPAQDYFADGMTDELITTLGQVNSFRVISRTSVMQYRGSHKPLPQIARELNVDAIVEGAIVRSGTKVRITAQLIQAASDKHLWAQSYEGDVQDVLRLQDEVARAIANQVQSTFVPGEKIRAGVIRPSNLEAYELYLRGEYFLNRATPDSVRTAAKYFQQAIEHDPNYPPAYTKLAGCYHILANMGAIPQKVGYVQAKPLLSKALELDPQFSAAHAVLGWNLLLYDLNFDAAKVEFTRAVELNSNGVEAHQGLGDYYASVGQAEESVREMQHARELDPLGSFVNGDLCMTLYFARRFDEALAQCKANLDLNPNSIFPLLHIEQIYVTMGMDSEAISTYLRHLELVGAPARMISAAKAGASKSGVSGYWRAMLPFIPENLANGNINSYDAALAYTYGGDKDKALAFLEKAVKARCYGITHLSVDPTFDTLRSDPRFTSLLRRMRLQQRS